MHFFKVRNFEEFQHYSKRNPPWIRLYYRLLHDRRFFRLEDADKFVVIGCYLLASQNGNRIPCDQLWIDRELSLTHAPDWKAIADQEFILPIDCDASTMLTLLDAGRVFAGPAGTAGLRTESALMWPKPNINEELKRPSDCDASVVPPRSTDIQNTEAQRTEILSTSRKAAKWSPQEVSEVFRFWNQQPATMHHRTVNGQEKAIIKALRLYAPAEIRRAIERYSQVRANAAGKYRQLYQWTLGEFLTRQEGYNLVRFNAEDWEQPFLAAHRNGSGDQARRERDRITGGLCPKCGAYPRGACECEPRKEESACAE